MLIKLNEDRYVSASDISSVFIQGEYVYVKTTDGEIIYVPGGYGETRFRTLDRISKEVNEARKNITEKQMQQIAELIEKSQVK